jgi:hypothetical protein
MLPFVATKTVPNNRRVEVELPDVEPGTPVTVLIVPANVTIPVVDAAAARRKANGWLTDRVGHLVMGKDPRMLSDGKRTWWRVAAYVTNVHREPFGPIGFVDVDAASGKVLSDDNTAQELQQYGARLERHPLAAGN